MKQFDARLEEMSKSELGAGEQLLEFCPAQREVTLLPKPLAPLIPISIVGLSFLSLATKDGGLFAFLAGGILVGVMVFFFLHFKTYLVVAGGTELLLLNVSANLGKREGVARLAYREVVAISEPGKPPSCRVRLGASEIKLNFVTTNARLKSGKTRAENLLRILREKADEKARASAAATA